ncbi:MAG TPA: rhomboid family intramembrane serine protease [Tahibacter sp.]|uniref:rhomboid family intramembrane serine protease n=1 Tax=Tahibacter sp. TaxID=2056211 RepID=UPI002BB4FBBE|nr:rhomboid family intramembrane serine protease [Tahibacter sp.]HSX59594.1 rhomboid family intramembrane serine protease [Tahibacter sp.]
MSPPLVVVWLVIANLVMFAAQWALGDRMALYFALWPPGEHVVGMAGARTIVAGFQPLQLITYGFLHGGVGHVAINLTGLLLFGPMVERCMGGGHFLFYYAFCLVSAGVCQLLLGLGDGIGATVGASGAIYGVLAAAALLYPDRKVLLLPLPGELEARTLALLLGGLSVLHGVTGTQAGTAHFAHLGGMAGGWLLVQYWRGRLPVKPRRLLVP